VDASIKRIVTIFQIELRSSTLAKLRILGGKRLINLFYIGSCFVKEFKELQVPNLTDFFELIHKINSQSALFLHAVLEKLNLIIYKWDIRVIFGDKRCIPVELILFKLKFFELGSKTIQQWVYLILWLIFYIFKTERWIVNLLARLQK